MTTDYYEPEALVEKLKVGTRVRYRISTECDYGCPDCCGQDWHRKWGDSGLGAITSISNNKIGRRCWPGCGAFYNDKKAHFYAIKVSGDVGERGFWAAAIELTPLEEVDG